MRNINITRCRLSEKVECYHGFNIMNAMAQGSILTNIYKRVKYDFDYAISVITPAVLKVLFDINIKKKLILRYFYIENVSGFISCNIYVPKFVCFIKARL